MKRTRNPRGRTARRAVLLAIVIGVGAAPVVATAAGGETPPVRPASSGPGRIAFDYGFRPWVVRECRETSPLSCGARVLRSFSHVVLNSGLETNGHPSHEETRRLIGAVRAGGSTTRAGGATTRAGGATTRAGGATTRAGGSTTRAGGATTRAGGATTEVWGYVSMIGGPDFNRDGRRDTVNRDSDIVRLASSWKRMGATGIFLDEDDLCAPATQACATGPGGREIAVTRARQVAVVHAIHGLGLAVFANGYSMADVLGTREGVPTPLGPSDGRRPADMYLMENPTFYAGVQRQGIDATAGSEKLASAASVRASTGVRMAAVDTLAGWAPDTAATPLARTGLARAASLDAYTITNSSYSSSGSVERNLPVLRELHGRGAAIR